MFVEVLKIMVCSYDSHIWRDVGSPANVNVSITVLKVCSIGLKIVQIIGMKVNAMAVVQRTAKPCWKGHRGTQSKNIPANDGLDGPKIPCAAFGEVPPGQILSIKEQSEQPVQQRKNSSSQLTGE